MNVENNPETVLISADKIVEILKQHGNFVTIEEANKIRDFISLMAAISLEQIFQNES